MVSSPQTPPPPAKPLPHGCRRLAWNGISFAVPANWEITVFRFLRRGASRIELEDEYTVRMEAEWVFGSKRKLDVENIIERYEKASKPLTVKAEEKTQVNGLPAGWHASQFVFKETGKDRKLGKLEVVTHGLVTAFYICPEKSMFAFFLLHFMPEDPEAPVTTIRQLAQSFTNHCTQSMIPWRLFDISFELPPAFRLQKTHFDIGCKMMRFDWQWRQLSLWYFSCADMILKETTADRWVTGYLNGYGGYKAVRFAPDGKGGITWRRRRPFILGHRSEIGKWCFKYVIGWRLDEDRNQLLAWVFHHRRHSDLRMLPDFVSG